MKHWMRQLVETQHNYVAEKWIYLPLDCPTSLPFFSGNYGCKLAFATKSFVIEVETVILETFRSIRLGLYVQRDNFLNVFIRCRNALLSQYYKLPIEIQHNREYDFHFHTERTETNTCSTNNAWVKNKSFVLFFFFAVAPFDYVGAKLTQFIHIIISIMLFVMCVCAAAAFFGSDATYLVFIPFNKMKTHIIKWKQKWSTTTAATTE